LNKLSTMKLVLDDEVQSLFMLSSLPDSWETLVVSFSNSASNTVMTMVMVKDIMFNENARRKEQDISLIHRHLLQKSRGEVKAENLIVMTVMTSQGESPRQEKR
jgi:hypothetical protein